MKNRAAVFDMDGTLVESDALAVGASEDGLREYYARRGEPPVLPSPSEIRALVGLPSLDYFAGLLPPDRRGDAAEVRTLVARHEVARLEAGEGRLFPGAEETLASLRSDGWRIGLVSNCGRIYFDANLRCLRLDRMVEAARCLDDGPSKSANVGRILAELGCSAGVMVGDRSGDVEAGRANGLRTVGCLHGFGTAEELRGADRTIRGLSELPELLRSWR